MPTALLSVYDKSAIAELAGGLHDLGWRLLSSGGTAQAIVAAGLPVTDVAELTGYPAILGHRVVTLHPAVHGGLLADPDDPEHRRDLDDHGIEPIDLLVAGLYPFAAAPGVELIDIGGPAMIRAAAKNHARVGVVIDAADHITVLDELRAHGRLSDATRRRLARTAFATTAAYDASIVDWLDGDAPGEAALPEWLHLRLDRAQDLRYGENPHQVAARYRRQGATSWWDGAV
ncbi:MAG: bifunctional phosphoribosylaminoimidazolecarboxamide formyltransferase/IMP cyclohydrolase, partial [Ilumatobacteraceae bacterium]